MKNNIACFTFLFLLCFNLVIGQNKTKFQTKADYLNFIDKKLKIEKENVFYISNEKPINSSLEKIDALIFVNNYEIGTFKELRELEGSKCSPNKLVKKIDDETIQKTLEKSESIKDLVIKNLKTGQQLNLDSGKYAIFFFTYQFGKSGLIYINDSNSYLRFGYRPIFIMTDGNDIIEDFDIDKDDIKIIK